MKLSEAKTEQEALIAWYEERTAALQAVERRYRAALMAVQKLLQESQRKDESLR